MITAKCPLCNGDAVVICRAMLHPGAERDVVRCSACQAAFYSPFPDGGELENCYRTAYYGGVLKQYWNDYYKGLRIGAELKQLKSKGSYLDVGCAFGTMLAGVRDASGWQVSGTEFSNETASIGMKINNVQIYAVRSLSAAGFKAESFDYIFANNVLEHLLDPLGFLADAHKLLRPGGRLQIVTPNGANDISPNEILWRKKKTVLGTRHAGHIWFFSERSLMNMFKRGGFCPIRFQGFHFIDVLKSRGIWPGALRRFEKMHAKLPDAVTHSESTTQETIVPPRKSRILDNAKARLRGICKSSLFRFGGDFDILLQRK